jgi:hypothetical protein
VRGMDLDPTCNRLAVFFEDSELVPVFRVQPKSANYLAPCGFIRGFPDEYPVALEFQKDFTDGALLTIAWSSGRLQYFPFVFGLPGGAKSLLHEDHYRNARLYATQQQHQQQGRRSLGNFPGGTGGLLNRSVGEASKSYTRQSFPFRSISSFNEPPESPQEPSAPSKDAMGNSADEEEDDDFEYVSQEEIQAQSPRLFSLSRTSL